MRFSLLCASTALAASLMLSACSSGGSSSAIPAALSRLRPRWGTGMAATIW